MARKIKFPLEMENGVQVNTVKELREHFYLLQIKTYFLDGRLEKWLRDRYEMDLADALGELEQGDDALGYKLCDIFGVEYSDAMELKPDAMEDGDAIQLGEENSQQIVKNVSNIEYSDNMVEETLSGELMVGAGEETDFYNKKLCVSGRIRCEGNLKFDHCIIIYNMLDTESEIEMIGHSSLCITNSMVLSKGFSRKPLVTGETNHISITSTRFEDCSMLFKCHVKEAFYLLQCDIKNCFYGFVDISSSDDAECIVKNNEIKQDELTSFNRRLVSEDGGWEELISIYGRYVHFCNNYIEESNKFTVTLRGIDSKKKLNYLNVGYGCNLEIHNCTFKGISPSIHASIIKNCIFIDCMDCIDFYRDEKKKKVQDCIFENCTNVIFGGSNVEIIRCQFISCYNQIICMNIFDQKGGVQIESCHFYNTRNTEKENRLGCITLARDFGVLTNENVISNCSFDGVDLGKNFLIRAWEQGFKPWDRVILIKNCKFRHCVTKRESGKIIKEYIQYSGGLLGKNQKNFHANNIVNCTGLDMINQEGAVAEEISVRMSSLADERIGYV